VGKDATYAPVVTFTINQSNGVTTVSQSLRDDTYRNFPISSTIEVIPNFVDLTRFRKARKEHFKKAIAPNGEKILIHTSNFRKVKRTGDVVEIFKIVQQSIPSKLLLVGDGPERQSMESLCREYGLMEHVRFLGKQEAVEELLAVSDLFLMPSETESFGLAALEAMACHVPVISSNTGGIPEINTDGFSGFLCSVGDTQSMAAYAVSLLSNDETLNRFKENAWQQALKFDINRILPQYESYYDKILKSTMPATSKIN
jgi:N-acetyl-alpha-D-glucosaminyl L-malate synthase BshA